VSSSDEDASPRIDPTLRERVSQGIEALTDAFDKAIADCNDQTLSELHKAADDLMRALGRVLLEIEQLRASHQGGA
jgi:cell division GTPase FtsZ